MQITIATLVLLRCLSRFGTSYWLCMWGCDIQKCAKMETTESQLSQPFLSYATIRILTWESLAAVCQSSKPHELNTVNRWWFIDLDYLLLLLFVSCTTGRKLGRTATHDGLAVLWTNVEVLSVNCISRRFCHSSWLFYLTLETSVLRSVVHFYT